MLHCRCDSETDTKFTLFAFCNFFLLVFAILFLVFVVVVLIFVLDKFCAIILRRIFSVSHASARDFRIFAKQFLNRCRL